MQEMLESSLGPYFEGDPALSEEYKPSDKLDVLSAFSSGTDPAIGVCCLLVPVICPYCTARGCGVVFG